jgi:hypothetical protein
MAAATGFWGSIDWGAVLVLLPRPPACASRTSAEGLARARVISPMSQASPFSRGFSLNPCAGSMSAPSIAASSKPRTTSERTTAKMASLRRPVGAPSRSRLRSSSGSLWQAA